MIVHRSCAQKKGGGLLNKIINNLPVELHLPGYQYCGPGTKLAQRLARGDTGINPLDSACKSHDIAYSKNRENIAARHEADKILAERAWKRVSAPDATIGEKAAALFVTNAMKAKTKLGMGVKYASGRSSLNARKSSSKKKQSSSNTKKSGLGVRKSGTGVKTGKKRVTRKMKQAAIGSIIRAARNSIKLNKGSHDAIKTALDGARLAVKRIGGKHQVNIPRVIPVPAKIGGFLPFLIPLFAGLSATGALAGGAAGIARAVNSAKVAKQELAENKRHNETMEAIALGKGVYLKPYKKGMGLYLKPKNL